MMCMYWQKTLNRVRILYSKSKFLDSMVAHVTFNPIRVKRLHDGLIVKVSLSNLLTTHAALYQTIVIPVVRIKAWFSFHHWHNLPKVIILLFYVTLRYTLKTAKFINLATSLCALSNNKSVTKKKIGFR